MSRSRTLRVAAIQMQHGPALDDNLGEARRLLAMAKRSHVQLAVLPEYFFATFRGEPRQDGTRVRRFLSEFTKESAMAVAANAIESFRNGLRNVGLLYRDGRPVLVQQKVHPMPRETEYGVKAGSTFAVAPIDGHPTGILVCSDILYPEAARILALRGARVLLNPVMSPLHRVDPAREARESVYVARAYDSGAFVVKAGGWRRGRPTVVGRSLITAPWGILAHYADEFSSEVLVADLDFRRLDEFHARQAGFPPRRPQAYGDLVRRSKVV